MSTHPPHTQDALLAETERLQKALVVSEQQVESMREELREYACLRESSTGAWFLLAPDYTIINHNAYGKALAEHIWGKPLEKGHSMLDYSNPENTGAFLEAVSKGFEGEEVKLQLPITYPNGKRFVYAVRYIPVKDESGEIWAVAFTAENITEAYDKELELKESEKRFRELANTGTALIWLTDENDKLEFLSESWGRELGGSMAHIYKDYFRYAHPEDLSRYNSLYQTARSNLSDFEFTGRIKNHTGNYALYTYTGHPRYDAEGEYMGMIGSATNNDRLLQEKDAFEQVSLVATYTKDGIMVTDLDHHIVWVNAAFSEMLGYTPAELVGEHVLKFYKERPDMQEYHWILDQLHQGKSVDLETNFYTKNGRSIRIHEVITPLKAEDNQPYHFITSVRDVTERHKLQQELAKTNQRFLEVAIQSQEEERKRMANELHDGLGVLLSVTGMHLSLLHDIDLKSIKQADFKAKVFDIELMLKDAMRDLRAISHNMHPPALQMLGLGVAIEQLLQRTFSGAKITLETTIDKSALDLYDEQQSLLIYRILQEVVNNIVKHAEATKVIVNITPKDTGFLNLEITDNGVGFDSDDIRNTPGLGYDTIASRSELLGGKCNIVSSPGNGCLVTCKLRLPDNYSD